VNGHVGKLWFCWSEKKERKKSQWRKKKKTGTTVGEKKTTWGESFKLMEGKGKVERLGEGKESPLKKASNEEFRWDKVWGNPWELKDMAKTSEGSVGRGEGGLTMGFYEGPTVGGSTS